MSNRDYFKDGLSEYQKGRLYQSISLLQIASEIDSQNPKVWNALGVVLSKSGDYDSAVTSFENALMLDPGNITYEKNLNISSKRQNDKIKSAKNKIPQIEFKQEKKKPILNTVDSRPFWLGLIGMFIGWIVGIIGLFFGIFASLFGGAFILIWGFLTILFSFVGFIGTIVHQKQYGIILLIMSGVFILIFTLGFGFISSFMFISSAYLISRSNSSNRRDLINFKENGVKKGIYTFGIVILLLIGIFGFISIGSAHTESDSYLHETSGTSMKTQVDFSTVTHGSMKVSVTKNWDADAQDDGIIIYPDLLDSHDRSVKWNGITLPVKIDFWTQKYGDNFKVEKDQFIGTINGKISSSDDGNWFKEGGIRIELNQINPPEGEKSGIAVVKVTLPDGRVIESEDSYIPLIT